MDNRNKRGRESCVYASKEQVSAIVLGIGQWWHTRPVVVVVVVPFQLRRRRRRRRTCQSCEHCCPFSFILSFILQFIPCISSTGNISISSWLPSFSVGQQQQQLRERHTHITDWILSVRECTLTVVHWKAVYTDSSFSSLVVSWRSRPPFYYFVFNCRCARCGNWNQEQVHVTWSNPLLGWMGDISGTAGTNAIRMLIISGANWIVGPVRARALPIGENNARTHARAAQFNSIPFDVMSMHALLFYYWSGRDS